MKILALWLLLLPWAAQAVELEINIVPQEEHGGVKFTGSTNLPDNARLMVLFERNTFKDEDTVTVKDGRYETKLFRGRGNRSVQGEFTVTIFARFNERWQYASLLPVLKTYQSPLISGDRLAARTTVNLKGSTRPPPSPPPRQSTTPPRTARPSLPDTPPPETRPQPRVQQSPPRNYAADADLIVALLNSQYGRVCQAELTGWWSKTLKIDWTADTKKIHAMKVLAEIGSVKEQLYADGVRYLQFPNDAGGYNVIDWETGKKTSISDRAPYFFR